MFFMLFSSVCFLAEVSGIRYQSAGTLHHLPAFLNRYPRACVLCVHACVREDARYKRSINGCRGGLVLVEMVFLSICVFLFSFLLRLE